MKLIAPPGQAHLSKLAAANVSKPLVDVGLNESFSVKVSPLRELEA